MPKFDLEQYETVEERIARFYEAHPNGRIITENLTTPQDRTVGVWVVKTTIYLTEGDQAAGLPKATGHAFEIDGEGMANKTAALENCETSSIGRCLANLGMSGNRGRVTREEMQKVARGATPKPATDWAAEAEASDDVNEVRALYNKAKAAAADVETLEKVKARGKQLSDAGSNQGADRSV